MKWIFLYCYNRVQKAKKEGRWREKLDLLQLQAATELGSQLERERDKASRLLFGSIGKFSAAEEAAGITHESASTESSSTSSEAEPTTTEPSTEATTEVESTSEASTSDDAGTGDVSTEDDMAW